MKKEIQIISGKIGVQIVLKQELPGNMEAVVAEHCYDWDRMSEEDKEKHIETLEGELRRTVDNYKQPASISVESKS